MVAAMGEKVVDEWVKQMAGMKAVSLVVMTVAMLEVAKVSKRVALKVEDLELNMAVQRVQRLGIRKVDQMDAVMVDRMVDKMEYQQAEPLALQKVVD